MGYYAKRMWGSGIVKDGLQLWLDASNPASYPGSGTTWFDLSGNGNNGTMIGGVTPLSNAMRFDGINDYVLGSTNLGIVGDVDFSICYFAIWDGEFFSSNYPSAFGNNSTGTVLRGLSTTWQSGRVALDFWDSRFRATTPLQTRQWYFLSFTKHKGVVGSTTQIYVNAIQIPCLVENANNTPNIINSPFVVGRLDSIRWFNGRVNDILVYNRVISENEVQQIFNSQRSKYGI